MDHSHSLSRSGQPSKFTPVSDCAVLKKLQKKLNSYIIGHG